MYEPSGRPYSLAWRTITALTTSPFLTEPPGVASLTEATITSPIEASNFEPPATTRMHISSRAPVLSATRPTFVRRGLRSSGIGKLLLAQHCPHASNVPPHRANASRVRQLPCGELKTQLEHLLAELAQAHRRIGHRLGPRAAATRRLFLFATRLPRLPLRHSRGPP